ncbi:MAG: MerR family transcriptional regulator [Tannerella sp.]|jgi:DNA-binding transcriptional MerR regulator|nr:MerR family transcriptional regulator [Tannerella sp.]
MTQSDKKLYHSIREVAEIFDLQESTLRFWETKFHEISPRKTPNGIRQYTKEDIEMVRVVYYLLKTRKLTIAGARQRLDENREMVINHAAIIARLTNVKNKMLSLMKEVDQIERVNAEVR